MSRRIRMAGMIAFLIAGCGGSSGSGEFSFAFVVIADPHVYGTASADRLQACVDWVNANRVTEGIDLVFVAGDLGIPLSAKQILDDLDIPYLPVIGDNVIQGGTEPDFETAFQPHYAALAGVLENFSRQPTPVFNPDIGSSSWLQDFSFDHQGVHFLACDWCTRTVGGPTSETADLHDFPGGTWPWFESEIAAHAHGREERIVMVSHHPMHDLVGGAGSFSRSEMEVIEGVTAAHGRWVYANFAGHYHFDWVETRAEGGYVLYVTDATWDDENTFRLVRVYETATSYEYRHEIVRP